MTKTANEIFDCAGFSRNKNGKVTVNFGNGYMKRLTMMQRGGNTEIFLHVLPAPMTRLQAVEWLMEQFYEVLSEEQTIAANFMYGKLRGELFALQVSDDEVDRLRFESLTTRPDEQ